MIDSTGPLWDGLRHYWIHMPGPNPPWPIPVWAETTEEQKIAFCFSTLSATMALAEAMLKASRLGT